MSRLHRGLIRVGPDLALLGVGLVLIVSIAAAFFYSGADWESYSPLNHTVSELGERGVSELAALFNAGLIVGGLLIALYMVSLVLRFERRAGRILGVLGAAAGVAMALVGVVPVDVLEPHIVVAAVAFLLILATALWFAVWCLRGDAPYPRWLGWFAAVVVTLVVVFMLVPRILQPEYTFEMEYNLETPRPDVLLNSTFEWVVVLSAWIWIAALAIHDRPRQGDKP